MSKGLMLKIKVTNLDTKQEFVHSNVPIDHVEMIRMNPNLRVEVLGRGRGRGRRSARNEKDSTK